MPNKFQREIYLIKLGQTNLYKIGISKNPNKRLSQLQTGCPYSLSIVSSYVSESPFKVEKILHNSFLSKKSPENFKYDFEYLKGEWFELKNEDIINFKSICKIIENRIDTLKTAGNPFI